MAHHTEMSQVGTDLFVPEVEWKSPWKDSLAQNIIRASINVLRASATFRCRAFRLKTSRNYVQLIVSLFFSNCICEREIVDRPTWLIKSPRLSLAAYGY